MAAGSIIVDLLMRTGSFENDTARAEKALRNFQRGATEVGKTIGVGLAAGIGLAIVAFDQLVKQAANFKDLEEITGANAEALASFSIAAGTAGTSMESIAGATVKLTKNLQGVDDESMAAGAALTALNLPIDEFKKLDPATQMETVAKALAGFKDGAQKTAIAVALFGKEGAALLPFLKELETQGGRQVILTQEQIELADEYADKQARLRAELSVLAQVAATQMLPAFNAFAEASKEVVRELLGIDQVAGKVARDNQVAEFAEAAVKALGFIVDAGQGVSRVFEGIGKGLGAQASAVAAIARGDFAQAKQIIVDFAKDIDAIAQRELFSDKLQRALAAGKANVGQKAIEDRGFDPRQQLNFNGPIKGAAGGAKDDPTKKLLDNRIKAIEAAANREQEIAEDRNRFLDLFNDQSLLSISAYYDAQRVILEAGTQSQVNAYDEQIAALEAFQAKASKATDRADAQGKINDLIEKREAIQTRAGSKGIELAIKQAQAEKQLADQIKGINANVLELQGNFAAAAAIRFDLQNADLFNRLTAQGNQEALNLLKTLKQATIAQAEFGKATDAYNSILTDLGIKEQRIQIGRQLGATTELGALKALGDARMLAVSQLEAQIRVLDQIPAKTPAQIQALEQLRVKLEELAASADPLGDKFRGIFEDSAGNAFADFITGAKSASEAFKSFSNSVLNEISRMIAQNFARSIFGATSAGGGLVGTFFSSLFGGAKADGGPVSSGVPYLVGERGPEMFVPRTAGSIVPAKQTAQMTGQRPLAVTNNFVLSGSVDHRTQQQVATSAGQGVQRAVARNT
jgi:hypothetical protein